MPQQWRKQLLIITDSAFNKVKRDEIMESLDIWAEKVIEDAIKNIKERRIVTGDKYSGYDIANWRLDWLWMNDTESNFDYFCKLAGLNSSKLRDETFRLAKARISDNIMKSKEWKLALKSEKRSKGAYKMAWSDCGMDSCGRNIGYSYEGYCDHPECPEKIDRGLTYVCGGMHGNNEYSCERYFCDKHKSNWIKISDGEEIVICDDCYEDLLDSGEWEECEEENLLFNINEWGYVVGDKGVIWESK